MLAQTWVSGLVLLGSVIMIVATTIYCILPDRDVRGKLLGYILIAIGLLGAGCVAVAQITVALRP
jgi:hypothetical protein